MFRRFNNNSNTSSQTATTTTEASDRPRIQVKPRGIGPINRLHENDVLCGRGGRINGHSGNIQFRRICGEKREEYFAKDIKKIQKAHIAASVVERIRGMTPPGRFLKQDTSTGEWYDIGCAKAMTKVGQAIREHTPKEDDDSGNQQFDGFYGSEKGGAGSFNNEPLYPGYDPSQLDNNTPEQPQQQCSTLPATTQACPMSVEQPYNGNGNKHIDDSAQPPATFGVANYRRQSNLSAMSGMTLSSLRSSAVSDLSTSLKMSTRSNYNLSLLRESILSDISDYDMTDNDHQLANQRLGMMSSNDALPIAGGFHTAADLEPRPFPPAHQHITNNNGAGEEPLIQQQDLKRSRRRRSSIMSISMASTLSILSIGSITSWGAF